MQHRIIATAIAFLFGFSMPALVSAKGRGGGHSGGAHAGSGHSSGAHSGSGHSGGGQKGGFRGGGGIKGSGGGTSGGGTAPAGPRGSAPARPASTSRPPDDSRSPDGHTVVGTAVPRSPRSHDVFVVTPSIYTPRFSHTHFPALGFGFGF